jgi:hypothetical protein
MPCGWNDPDADEPANNLWESATSYGYGWWEGRTFWNPEFPSEVAWLDPDWYQWDVEWTGKHWLWIYGLDPAATRSLIQVFAATGDPLEPLILLEWGEAYHNTRLEVYLVEGGTYYVKVTNLSPHPACYNLRLDP